MAKSESRTDVRLTADIETGEQPLRKMQPVNPRTFIVVVLGDFRGAIDDTPPLNTRRFVDIDRDSFDAVLARYAPAWTGSLKAAGPTSAAVPIALAFREIDDFHPDRIVHRIDALKTLLDTRSALLDPARFEAVAAEISAWTASIPGTGPAQGPSAPPPKPPQIPTEGLLDRILGEELATTTSTRAAPDDLQRFLQELIAPHVVKLDTQRQTELVAAVDQALSAALSSILHDPAFQQCEATWRSLLRLVSAVDSDVAFKIRLLHCTKAELQQDLAQDDITQSAVVRLMVEDASIPGSVAPALLIGNYSFDHGDDDVQLLGLLGAIAEQLQAPFVAAASSRLFGCDAFADLADAGDPRARSEDPAYRAWNGLRRLPPARWVALAVPRVLCRVPYGTDSDAIASFVFEECPGPHRHDDLLWGNGAFAFATVVARAFAADEWNLNITSEAQQLDGFPLYVYRDEGSSAVKPCAEVLIGERLLDGLVDAGVLPLVTYRNTDVVTLPCIQSLAVPRSPLSFRSAR